VLEVLHSVSQWLPTKGPQTGAGPVSDVHKNACVEIVHIPRQHGIQRRRFGKLTGPQQWKQTFLVRRGVSGPLFEPGSFRS
jgi:hypothetical protein